MNVCLFSGQGNTKKLNFDKYSNIYFERVYNFLKIEKNELLDNKNYNQILNLIYNVSNFDKLKEEDSEFFNNLNYLIGYSLGEYSALVCSESISFEDCVKLIKFRSEQMYKCGLNTNSTMISIIGVNEFFLKNILKGIEYYISIYLSSNDFVLSVNKNDLKTICKKFDNQKKFNNIHYKILKVDGGFHSPYMEDMTTEFTNYINSINFKIPKYYVISNYDANIYKSINNIKKNLILHLTSPVRWDNICKNLHNNNIYELGGNNLEKILKLNNITMTNYRYLG